MANLTLTTTLVASTGTGAVMEPFKMEGDKALYSEMSPSGIAAKLALGRTEPKPTKDYAGAMKGEVRFTRQYADANGRLWPAVFLATTSLPVFRTDAERSAFVVEALNALLLTASKDNLSKIAVPQS